MRHYECKCTVCGYKRQIAFSQEPYPELDDVFSFNCPSCNCETEYTRVLTKKAAAEQRKKEQEQSLRSLIVAKCNQYGFKCRFLYQSVIITTPISDWSFDYHTPRITLYHESTEKINRDTGNYAKSHLQFRDKKMTSVEVIDYISKHDIWRMEQNMAKRSQ